MSIDADLGLPRIRATVAQAPYNEYALTAYRAAGRQGTAAGGRAGIRLHGSGLRRMPMSALTRGLHPRSAPA